MKIYAIYKENSLFARGHTPESSAIVRKLYWSKYDDFSGKITIKKINKLMDIYRPLEAKTADRTASTATNDPDTYTGNVYMDLNVFKLCYVKPMEYYYTYKSYANSVTASAKDNMSFYRNFGNIYEYRKNAAIMNIFKGRAVKDFSYLEMFEYYTHYDFSSLLVLLICLYGLVNVFVTEKETDMEALLLTTKSGGRKTTMAKILSSTLFVCLVSLWFYLVDFIAYYTMFGSIEGASAPLYAIENFSNTTLNLNLWQYVALSCITKTIGMLVLGLGVLLLSCLFKNGLQPFIISLSSAFGLIYLQSTFTGVSHTFLKALNPFTLMVNRELFQKTDFVNVLGFPVAGYALALIITALWGVLFFIGITVLVKKSNYIRKGGLKNAFSAL